MKKIVLLSSTGQVGFELVRSLGVLGDVSVINRHDVDFVNTKTLCNIVARLSPDVIVNAAAYTAVDKAETESELADKINHQLPRQLAQVANDAGALLVHYSSDYVYPGDGDTPWLEDDTTGPLSTYGDSKLAGDMAIEELSQHYLIFRTSWVYAARGNNFMQTMIKLASQREALSVVSDQYGAPTPARLIAQVSALAIEKYFKDKENKQLNGIYHLAPTGVTTWYGFAETIFDILESKAIKLALNRDKFIAIPTQDYPTPAARPKNSRLNVDKIQSVFGVSLPKWDTQLVLTIEEYLEYNAL